MSQTLEVPEELYQSLARYAAQQKQTLAEALASLLETSISQGAATTANAAGSQGPVTSPPSDSEYRNPWSGFYDAFEIDPPDAIERHDYYIGQQALEPHDDDD